MNIGKKKEEEVISSGMGSGQKVGADAGGIGTKDYAKAAAQNVADSSYTDFTKGTDYQSLAKRYKQSGQTAMQDTLGQVAARTGGMASSYAGSAAQQSYNNYMGGLEDAARALYDSERQELIDKYNLANSMYLQDRDEQRYTDELVYNRQWNEDERTYNRSEKERLEGKETAITTIEEMIAAGVPIEDIDPALIEQSGYGLGYWGAYATNNTNATNKETLEDYEDIIADGGDVTLDQWLAAGGDEATYNSVMSIGTNLSNQNTLAQYRDIIASGGDVTLDQWIAAGGDEATYNSVMSMQTNANNATKLGTYTNNILNGMDVTLDQWLDAGGTEADYNMYKDGYATIQNNATLKNYADIIASGGDVTLDQWLAANGTEDDYNSYMSIRTNAQAKADEKTTKEQADSVIKSYIDAFGKLDGLDESWFEKSSMPKDYWTSEVQKATNKQAGENKQTAIDEVWAHINASGNVDDLTDDQIAATGYSRGFWENQQTLFKEGKATEQSQKANMELTAALEAGMNLEDIEGYENLVEQTGLSMLYWTAIDMATDSEGEAKAYQEIMAAIEAGKFDNVTDELIAKSGYSKSYFEYMKAIKMEEDSSSEYANNIETVFAALQAGMSLDEINAKDSSLIGKTGKDAFYWEVVEKQFEKERQAELDAKTAKEIADAKAEAFEDVEMRIAGGESLTSIGSGTLASTGKSYEYWLAYENIINSQASAKDMAVFYEVKYEDAANWMAKIGEATTYEEAEDIAALAASSTGNWDFADDLRLMWENKHKNTPLG